MATEPGRMATKIIPQNAANQNPENYTSENIAPKITQNSSGSRRKCEAMAPQPKEEETERGARKGCRRTETDTHRRT